MPRTLLVAYEDVPQLAAVEQRVVDGQDRAAGQAEDGVDAEQLEAADDRLRAGELPMPAAILAIPLGFLAGIIGTYLGKPDNFDELQAEMEVRSLTGVGVEAPVDH